MPKKMRKGAEKEKIVKCGRHAIKISNENKIIFPKSKITKGDLIEYYYHIAPIMLPYMKNRPLNMLRYPNGIDQEGFYQKEIGDYFPSWIKRKVIKKREEGKTQYVVCNNAATLVYLANQACITPHLWLSRIDKLDTPDQMIFDLDPPPPGTNFHLVQKIALRLKEIIEESGLTPFVKTTGSKGLHITVPLKRTTNFTEVRVYARAFAQRLVDDDPKNITLEMRKEKRGKRIFIDTLRNAFGQTAAAPYSVRPLEGAPIATPLFWDEVFDKKLTSRRYTIKNIFDYLQKEGDPWHDMHTYAKSIKSLHI
jgi:bifunctional non-homologous end joining protein LigD